MDEKYIADAIRRLRKESGESVETVGAAVNRSGKTVSAWETGRNVPSADMLIDICRHFKVGIDYFYPPEVTASDALLSDERELLELYRSMDANGREMALCAVRGMASSRADSGHVEERLA